MLLCGYCGAMMQRFKPIFLLAPLAALLIAAAPSAMPGATPDRADRLAQAAALVDNGKPADALAILDPLLAESDLPADKGQVEGLRSFALARIGKFAEARAASRQGSRKACIRPGQQGSQSIPRSR